MHGSKPPRSRKRELPIPVAFPVALSVSFVTFSSAVAGPTGGVVVTGQATISTPNASSTVIDQSSSRVQLNWNTFNIGSSESVRFNQPTNTAVAVNRILDQNPSQIFGSLQANGRVVLVNPNGMFFGPTASLNVGSLVASSLDVSGFDPVTGRYSFSSSRLDPGAITNAGSITAAKGGSVTLLGGRVTNTGHIIADFGTVNLAAGRAATLDLEGDGLLRLTVDSDLVANSAGADSAVANSGSIQASGGQVLLTAQALENVYSSLVNNTGVVRAGRIDNTGGVIRLIGTGGTVISSGTLDAAAGDAASTGGSVAVLGNQVGLFDDAVVNVSGSTGGGTALIGGDFHGANPDVLNASRTYVGPGAVINADAGTTGDGGKVVVWSDEVTKYFGSLSARGGSVSGNGGSAEVSGKALDLGGTSNLTAAHGSVGILLLDPDNLTIDDAGPNPQATLPGTPPYTYAFADDTGSTTNITSAVLNPLLTANNITLQSKGFIQEAVGTTVTGTGAFGLTLQAVGDITLAGTITNNSGSVSLQSGGSVSLTGTINAASVSASAGVDLNGNTGGPHSTLTMIGGTINTSGNVNLFSSGNMTIGGITSTGGALDAEVTTLSGSSIGGGSLTVAAAVSANGVTLKSFNTGNDLVLQGNVAAGSSGTATLTSDGSIVASGAPVVAGSAVQLIATNNIGTVTSFGAALDSNVGVPVTVQTNGGQLTATSIGSGNINLALSGAVAVANGHIDTNGGSIVLQSAGNLDTSGWTAGALSSGGGDVGLRSGGTLTVPAAVNGGVTDILTGTPNKLLLESGSGGFNDGTANHLTVAAANNLDVRTGSAFTTVNASSLTGILDVSAPAAAGLFVNSSGTLRLGTITAGVGNLSISSSGGALLDDSVPATGITAGNLTLSGTAIGTSVVPISTTVSDLDATASGAGGVFVSNTGALLLAANSAGPVSITNTTGALTVGHGGVGITVTGTGDVDLESQGLGNQIVVNTPINAGPINNVTLRTDTSGATQGSITGLGLITGNLLTLNGSTLGVSAVNRLATNVARLNATATQGVWVNNQGPLVLNQSGGTGGNSGAVDIVDTGSMTVLAASGQGVTLNAQGNGANIDVNGTIDGGTGNGSLTAGDLGNRGAIIADAGNSVIGNNLTLTAATVGASGGGNALNTQASALTGTTSGGLYLANTLNDLVLSNVQGGAGAVSISDSGQTITGSSPVVAGALTLNAGQIGGGTVTPLAAQVGSIDATSTSGVFINNTSGAALSSVKAAGGTGQAWVRADGSITTGAVSGNGVSLVTTGGTNSITVGGLVNGGAGTVTLIAPGTITTTGGSIAGNDLQVSGSVIGISTSQPLSTAVNSVTATSGGGVFLADANDITVTNATGGTGGVNVSSGSGALTVDAASATANGVTLGSGAGQGIDIEGTVDAGTTGTVSITAGTAGNRGLITSGTTGLVKGATLIATGSGVGGGTSTQGLVTNAVTLNLTGNGTGPNAGIWITDQGPATLVNAQGGTGVVTVTTNGNLTLATNLTGGAANLFATNGTSTLDLSGGTINVAGGVHLTAVGAITDDNLGTTSITGGQIILSAASVGSGTANPLDINSNGPLTATSTTGGIYVAEHGRDLTLNNLNSAAAVSIDAGTNAIFSNSSTSIVGTTLALNGSRLGINDTNPLNTQVSSLSANSTGGLYITNNGALILTKAVGGSGAADVQATGGALTVNTTVTGSSARLAATGAGNNLDLTLGSVNVGAGSASLVSGGVIAFGAGPVIADNLTLSATSLGTLGSPLPTQASIVNATATAGDIYILQSHASAVTANATGGNVDVETSGAGLTINGASGHNVQLIARGAGNALTVNGAVTATGGTVDLEATGDNASVVLNAPVTAAGNGIGIRAGSVTQPGAVAAGANSLITGLTLSASGSIIGSFGNPLLTHVTSLTSFSGNGMFVQQTTGPLIVLSAIGGTGPVDVATQNGDLTIGGVTGSSTTLSTGTAGNSLNINGTIEVLGGAANLTSGGAIVDLIQGSPFQAASATVSGTAIGTSSAPIEIDAPALSASASSGGIYLLTGTTALTANATGGPVSVFSGGALNINSATGQGVSLTTRFSQDITIGGVIDGEGADVTLTAGSTPGSIAHVTGGGTVTGNTLNVTADSVSGANTGTGLATHVTTLNGVATEGLAISNTGALAVAAATGHDVQLAATGAISTNPGGQITGNTVTLAGTALGTSATRLATNAGSIVANASNGGIFIAEAGPGQFTGTATGGAVDVTTTNGALTVGGATGTTVSLSSGGTGSGLGIAGVVDAGSGNATLTAGTSGSGAITMTSGQVRANTLTATGTSIGTSGSVLLTNVSTLNATSGTGGIYVTQAGGALALGVVNGATDVTINAGSNAITAGVGNTISGGVLTLVGSTLGGSGTGQRLNTDVTSLSGTSTGGLFITEANDLTVTAAAGGTGAADVQTTNGTLAVNGNVTGSTVTLAAGGAGHNLDLTGGSVNAGSGTAILRAGGLLTYAGTGSAVTAGLLQVTATSIGSAGTPLVTSVPTLLATSTAGGIYVSQGSSLDLTAQATGGVVDARTTTGTLAVSAATGTAVTLAGAGGLTAGGLNATAGDINLSTGAGGNIAISTVPSQATGNVSIVSGDNGSIALSQAVTAGGNMTVIAGGAGAPGSVTAGGSEDVAANKITVFGSTIGTSTVPVIVSTPQLDATSSGGLFVQQATGPLTVLNAVGGSGGVNISTLSGDLTVDSVTGSSTNLSTTTAGHALNMAGPINVGSGSATLFSAGTLLDISASGLLTAGNANLGGTSIGAPTSPFMVSAGTTSATASAGGVFLNATGGTLTANATGGTVAVTSSGQLTVNSVAGTGVTLTTGTSDVLLNGAVDAKGGDATIAAGTGHVSGGGSITANTLNITADSVSGSAAGTGLATHINTLNGTATEGLGISNTGALAVATATGHDVLLASTGAISANSGVAITGNTVTLNGTTLGTSGTRLATNAGSINATATNGGIYITETDAAQFTGSATGGAVDVKTTNGALTVGGATGTSVTLASGGTGSGLSIGGIVDAGSGNVALTAGNSGSGAITMTGGQVRGAVLTANATGIGTSAAPLLTKIGTLNATAGSGGLFVSEADDLTLAAITSGGDVGIKNSTGNLTVQSLTGANISLAAAGGAIVDDGNDTTTISGNALTLSGQAIGAPSTLTGTTLNVTPRLDTNVSSLTATSTNGGIYIDQTKGLQTVDLNASGGATGNIELLVATGDLNLHSARASHTLLLAAGGNIFAAPGLGNITAQQAELRAGTADSAAGHIGTLAAPLTFSLPTGNNLRLYVPSTIDSKDSVRSPSTLTSPGVNTTLTLFTALDSQAALAGFGQFAGFGETQFTSALESLIKTIQGQTGNVQGVLNIDWGSFDPNVSLFGTLDPAVCLPGDQRDEEGAKGGC